MNKMTFKGKALNEWMREGLLKKCTLNRAKKLGDVGQRFIDKKQPSIEAQLTNVCDEIAYNNHDVDKYELYDDKRGDGSITRYFQSSNIKEIKTYTSNQLNGEYSLYYDNPNNTLNIKGEYLLGSKIGNWEVFDLNGNFQNYFE